jgi:hypothetical protein
MPNPRHALEHVQDITAVIHRRGGYLHNAPRVIKLFILQGIMQSPIALERL